MISHRSISGAGAAYVSHKWHTAQFYPLITEPCRWRMVLISAAQTKITLIAFISLLIGIVSFISFLRLSKITQTTGKPTGSWDADYQFGLITLALGVCHVFSAHLSAHVLLNLLFVSLSCSHFKYLSLVAEGTGRW